MEGIFVDELEHKSYDHLPKDNQNLKDVSVKEPKTPTGPTNSLNDQSNQNFNSSDHPSTGPENDLDDKKKKDYPENYRTCLDLLQFFGDAVSVGR